jgi:DNA-binding transcriptional MerR regulator
LAADRAKEVIILEQKWLTISEAEEKTGIPERTIRRYINLHGHRLPIKRQHRVYYVSTDALPLLNEIRTYYADGLTAERVEEELSRVNIPATITIADTGKAVTATEAINTLLGTVADMTDELAELKEQLAATTELVRKQDQKADERDQRLMEVLREIQEQKQQRKSFWQRLMGR